MNNNYDFKKLFKLDGTFKESKLETSFLDNKWKNYSNRIRIASILTGIAYLAGIYNDSLILEGRGDFQLMIIARLVTFFIAVLCILATFSILGRKNIQGVIFFYFLVIAASECIELVLKPELGEQYLPFLIFIMIGYCLFYPVRPIFIILGGIIGTVSYSTVLISVNSMSFISASPTIITFCLVWFFSLFLVRSMSRSTRAEFHALNELVEVNGQLQDEIIERKRVEKKLVQLATIDELTQVYNRRQFTELAERELQRAERTDRPLSLLYMDIDHFKSVNDTYGHDTGDKVLIKIAAVCSQSIRGLDIFGRLGGEEFAVLLPEAGLQHAEMLGERLRRLIAETTIRLRDDIISVTASFGVSVFDRNRVDNLDKMVKRADLALYKAKEIGRNQVIVWSSSI